MASQALLLEYQKKKKKNLVAKCYLSEPGTQLFGSDAVLYDVLCYLGEPRSLYRHIVLFLTK